MTTLETPRFALPLLGVGQAHKELFHNDALLLLDFLVQPTVHDVADDPDILLPAEGDCWLVGSDAVSEWSGKVDQIACWSSGGWRYIQPRESMKITMLSNHSSVVYQCSAWQFIGQVSGPVAGTTIDLEARTAIDSILEVLRSAEILPQIN